MPVLSYLHQLFHAEACNNSIHTLRWQDRPRQCPRCHSPKVGPGRAYHYRQGRQRYRCKGCRRTAIPANNLAPSPFAINGMILIPSDFVVGGKPVSAIG
jgi:transposase-like protein